MNTTIFLTTLRQRFSSPGRMLLVAVVLLFPVGFAMLAGQAALAAARSGGVFAFLLGAGILGQESSSGVFQLLFARPVRRWEYVVSRWLAVSAAACVLVMVQVGLVCLVLASKGLPDSRDLLVLVAEQMLSAIGTTSVILLYSAFLSGVGDVIGIMLTAIGGQVLNGIGQLRQSEALIRVATEITRFVTPQLALGSQWSNGVPWFDLLSFLSTVAVSVAVAVVALNRREISYATD